MINITSGACGAGQLALLVYSGLAFVDDVTELLNQPVLAVQRIVRRREDKVDIDNMQEADKV